MKTRNQALDVLRGIAILLVIGFHYSYFHWWWQIGWTGVDLFFVLSGFLISGLLFEEYKKYGSINVVQFWIRRGFKIYPAFYLFIAVTSVSLATFHKLNIERLAVELGFLQSYLPHIWDHTWSLAVEEHFYVFLPVLLISLMKTSSSRKDPFRILPVAFIVVAAGCLALRYVALIDGATATVIHSESHLRMDSLLMGVTAGYLYHFRMSLFNRLRHPLSWIVATALLFPVAMFKPTSKFMDTLGLTMLYLGYGLVLANCVHMAATRNYAVRGVAWIGKYSYSIYLWHIPIMAMFFQGQITLKLMLVGGTASILFGALMSKLVEMPAIAIRDKLFPQYGGRSPKIVPEQVLLDSSTAVRPT